MKNTILKLRDESKLLYDLYINDKDSHEYTNKVNDVELIINKLHLEFGLSVDGAHMLIVEMLLDDLFNYDYISKIFKNRAILRSAVVGDSMFLIDNKVLVPKPFAISIPNLNPINLCEFVVKAKDEFTKEIKSRICDEYVKLANWKQIGNQSIFIGMMGFGVNQVNGEYRVSNDTDVIIVE